MLLILLVSCLFKTAYSCIPTQQVEATTTTTTPAPDPATPCVTCQKVYNKACVGYVAGSAWCSTASEASTSYEVGTVSTDSSTSIYDSSTFAYENGNCLLSYTCPAGTYVSVDSYGAAVPSDPYGYNNVFCYESGADAGQWYYVVYGTIDYAPVKIASIKCAG